MNSEFESLGSKRGVSLTRDLLLQMINQETGQRGFLLSGKDESLEPYNSGIIDFEKKTKEMKSYLTTFSSKQQAKINTLLDDAVSQANNWRTQAAVPEIEARKAMRNVQFTMADVTGFIEQGIGKNYMDRMRAILDKFVSAEQVLIVSRTENSNSNATFTMLTTILGTLFSIAIAAIGALMITRIIIRQLGEDPVKLQEIAQQISSGDLRGSDSSDDYSGVMKSMIEMREQLAEIIENKEFKEIIDAAKGGDLSRRIGLSGKEGSFRLLSSSINELIDVNEAVVSDTLKVVGAMAKGDLSQKIESSYEGSFDDLKQSLNQTIEQFMSIIQTDIQNIVISAKEGDLDQRINLDGKNGVFRELSTSMNQLLDVFSQVIGDTSNVFSSLSRGDLKTKIETPYLGRYDELKNDANHTVEQLKTVIEEDVQFMIKKASAGDLSGRIGLDEKEGFFYLLCETINSLFDVNENVINELGVVMGQVAQGNLNNPIKGDYSGKFLELKDSVNSTIGKLREIVTDINHTANSVKTISSEMAAGNEDLSRRSESQASSLEETASNMEEMTKTINATAENAKSARTISQSASKKAFEGGDVVQKANIAMAEILKSSNEITDIIGVIDEIAFQTNLLALNAAVEAARAGEMGRGFAVVAAEVRSLSQRSAGAAKQIKDLIRDSVIKVKSGAELVNASGEALSQIVASVESVANIILELSTASSDQATGIHQVNIAVTQIDSMNQQNAALVEQATASSIDLSSQAQAMKNKVDFFTL